MDKNPSSSRPSQAVRIGAEHLDGFLNLVGELVVIKSQIMQNETLALQRDQKLTGLMLLLDKTVRELQDHTLRMRMTSLHSCFTRLQTTVREVCARLDKVVELEVKGEDTELDRNIVEVLGDPLMHICRNAIDHGIESESERTGVGKPKHGKISIHAVRQGGRILIEISDDGRGLNRKQIIKKAIEAGLFPEGTTEDRINDRALFEVLFHPGFSTADQVGEISGRGVGLDVVKTALEQIKGSIDIETDEGVGTTFRLGIPLTTAISDAMVLRAAANTYVLPLEVIRELVQPEEAMLDKDEDGHMLINVRGSLLPVLVLKEVLGNSSGHQMNAPAQTEPEHPVALVVEVNGKRMALMADAVLGQNQVVVKSLGPALPSSQGIAGAAIMGDGRVGLIVDVVDLANSIRERMEACNS